MSLTKMPRGSDEVRFLDEVDFTVSLDSRSSSSHQTTSIEVASKPIILRASYRDIQLILTICNKAMAAYGQLSGPNTSSNSLQSRPAGRNTSVPSKSEHTHHSATAMKSSRQQALGLARVLVSKEQVGCYHHLALCF